MYRSTKTYGHELGLSACFRQWRADSHCHLIHGYALAFRFEFESPTLDIRNWVVDFGALSALKTQLQMNFDHKLIVAKDDPYIDELCVLGGLGVARVVVMNSVGCEAFARFGWQLAFDVIENLELAHPVQVVSCEVREHGANSAIYIHEQGDSWVR